MRGRCGARPVRSVLRREDGGTNAFFIILLAVGFMFASTLFVDFARLYISRRGAQNAVDAGALAGAGKYAEVLSTRGKTDDPITETGACGESEDDVAKRVKARYEDDWYSKAGNRGLGYSEAIYYEKQNKIDQTGRIAICSGKLNDRCRRAPKPFEVSVGTVKLVVHSVIVEISEGIQTYPAIMAGGTQVSVPASASAEAFPKVREFKSEPKDCEINGEPNVSYVVTLKMHWKTKLNY